MIMREHDDFWEKRPLTRDMIQYATQDVLYLPQVYQRMQSEFGHLKINHQYYQYGVKYNEEITVFNKIMRDTSLCTKYAFINQHIQSLDQIQINMVIQAFIKNFMDDRVYCSLNLGASGIVNDEQSVKTLYTYFDIGDIIQVQVEGFKGPRVLLKFLGPQIPSYIIPPISNYHHPHQTQQVIPVQSMPPFAHLAAT